MKLSVPKGESPVCTGVVPRSEVSGKVVYRKVCTELSQTAVSVLTNRNHIQRHKYVGERAHLCEALRIPKAYLCRCGRNRHKDIHLTEGDLWESSIPKRSQQRS